MKPSESSICPTCHSPIPDDAPGGLCPACTLEKAASVPHTGTGGRHAPPPAIEEIAPHFPELEILELLGAGGMGAVYKARQPKLDRFVALKILSHDLAGDPAFAERFNREARVLARLSHPNIVGGLRLRHRRALLLPADGVSSTGSTCARRCGPAASPRPRPWPSSRTSAPPCSSPTRRASCTATSSRRTSSSTPRAG